MARNATDSGFFAYCSLDSAGRVQLILLVAYKSGCGSSAYPFDMQLYHCHDSLASQAAYACNPTNSRFV